MPAWPVVVVVLVVLCGFALASNGQCGAPALAWFAYSGGGVAIGAGQTLCVRSGAETARTNGFSGYDPSVSPRP